MTKNVAVLVVNPVNGYGLFQYLETFYENKISYKTFAVSDTLHIKTNSGIALTIDDVISNLKGHEDEFDALIFSCGDAVPTFQQHANEPYNIALLEVIRAFAEKKKILIGHCAAGLLFEKGGVNKGKKGAIHPMAKPAIQAGNATDQPYEIDDNFYTAQTEHSIADMMPHLLEALKN